MREGEMVVYSIVVVSKYVILLLLLLLQSQQTNGFIGLADVTTSNTTTPQINAKSQLYQQHKINYMATQTADFRLITAKIEKSAKNRQTKFKINSQE